MESTSGHVHSRFFVLCLLFFATTLRISFSQKGQCVMYGQCGEGDFGTLNCLFNGPPKIIEDTESIELLKEICPEYVKDNKALTCCDADQISQLDANFKLPQRLIGRCPACFANFRKNFCKLICSPTQSDYIVATKTQKNEEGKEMVNELIYYISESYVTGLFESCRQVEGIIPGTRVIDLMCGKQGPKCTGPDWLEFMGSTPDNSGFSPVQINYTITTEDQMEVDGRTYFPMNETTFSCSEPLFAGQSACSCSDCPAACNKPETEAPPTTAAVPSIVPTTFSNVNHSVSTTKQAQKESIKTDEPTSKDKVASKEEDTSHASRFKLLDQKLFRRILSPLIVIAPAFADN